MPFPEAWPPRPASATRSIRFFQPGTTTARFEDSAYMFRDGAGANTVKPTPYVRPGSTDTVIYGTQAAGGSPMGGRRIPEDASRNLPAGQQAAPHGMLWGGTIRVINDGADPLEFTFDGTNIHGVLLTGEAFVYRNRFEAGIALRVRGDVAEGSITTIAVAQLIDGETFVLDDGINPAVTYEFDDNGSVVPSDILRPVDISAIVTADEVRDAIINAINTAPVSEITASDGGAATVDLVGLPGTASNVAIVDTVVNVGFIVTGMLGATGDPSDFRVEAW